MEFYKYVPLIIGMLCWIAGGNLITRRAAKSAGSRWPVALPLGLLKKMTLRELLMLAGCLLAFFGGFVATVELATH